MVKVPIEEVNRYGVLKESPLYKLPPPAWSAGTNVRIVNQGIGAFGLGWASILGTPSAAPQFVMPVKDGSQTWWLYMSATKGWVYGSSTHAEITRATGDYTASLPQNWQGTILGGIPIINNGLDIPQYWPSYALATDLANLLNWPTTLRAKIIRAIGPYLMAANLSDTGSIFPHRVRWSHPADPGSLPVSWDHTDATKDSRQVDIPDTDSGLITEMMALKEAMYVYKESRIDRFRPNGGRTVFSRDTLSEKAGCLTHRCVAVSGNGQYHLSLSVDDLVSHDGVRVRGLLTNRWKRTLFNNISESSLQACFMFPVPAFNEIVFMYPEAGFTKANRGLVWNYADNEGGAFTELEIPDGVVAAALGDLENQDTETWAALTNTWAETTQPWNTAARRKVVLADETNTKFYQFDSSVKRDGVAFTSTLQRTGLPIAGIDDQGGAVVDFTSKKMFTRIWPKIEGSPVSMRVGFQELVDGPVQWSTAETFNPATDTYVDLGPITGRAMALEISSTGQWLLNGYTVDVHPAGEYP